MSSDNAPNYRYWEPTTLKIRDLLDDVHGQRLALPQFQRDFKWGQKDYIPFLYSILQNRITGSLLILDIEPGSEQFAPRQIERGPVVDSSRLERLLLDGQQRTTTLYQALITGFKRHNKHYHPYINVTLMMESDYLLEEHIFLDKEAGRTAGEQAADGHIELQVLLDSKSRLTWQQEFAETAFSKERGWNQLEIFNQMTSRIVLYEHLPSYEFPATRLKKNSPPGLIVDIFQDINRRGRRLDEFELMVARCFNEKEPTGGDHYNLKTHWEQAFLAAPYLNKIGVGASSGLLPLYLIAAALKRETNELGSKPLGADAILSMNPTYITGTKIAGKECSIERAVEALEKAAKLLYEECGVIDRTLLPQSMMLIPIADQYFLERANRPALPKDHLKRWFWISGLKGDFYGSTTSYVTPACQYLEEWSKNPSGPTPLAVSNFDAASVTALDLRAAKARADDIIGKTVLAMVVASGSLDWKEMGTPLTTVVQAKGQSVEAHHIIPRKVLAGKNYYNCDEDNDKLRPIANFAPTSQTANGSLSSDIPKAVKAQLGARFEDILKSSAVPQPEFEKVKDRKSFESFLSVREVMLKKLLVGLLNL